MAGHEYLTANIVGSPIDISEILNNLPEGNWELVCVDNGRAYFKRLAPSPPFDIIDQDGAKVEFEQ